MRIHRPLAAVTLVVVVWLTTPAAVSAVTVDQIVSLSRAGVSETVILALLDRDRTVLTIDPEQVVELQRAGLSDTLIKAMLKSGRDEADAAARAASASAAAGVLASLDASPGFVVVGHGPDRPNTIHTEETYRGFRDGVRLPSADPLSPPYAIPRAARSRRAAAAREFWLPARAPMLCLAQVHTASGPGPSYVTECPEVMRR